MHAPRQHRSSSPQQTPSQQLVAQHWPLEQQNSESAQHLSWQQAPEQQIAGSFSQQVASASQQCPSQQLPEQQSSFDRHVCSAPPHGWHVFAERS
jgi:hypothetical protein